MGQVAPIAANATSVACVAPRSQYMGGVALSLSLAAAYSGPARPALRSDAARAVNPFGKVPTLVDGDVVLYESAAINTYLGDKFRGSEAPGEVLVPRAGTALRGRWKYHGAVRDPASGDVFAIPCNAPRVLWPQTAVH